MKPTWRNREGWRKRTLSVLGQSLRAKVVTSRLFAPIASVTFDDFPQSAWSSGGRILSKYDILGTYYVSGNFCDRTEDGIQYYRRDDLIDVHLAGHEIGSHTFSHRSILRQSISEAINDLERNESFVRGIIPDAFIATFAYPYGEVALLSKFVLAKLFSCCRGTVQGLNKGKMDLAQLRVVSVEMRNWDPQAFKRRVADAVASPAWIILVTHDVANSPSPFGCTPQILEFALATVRDAGIPFHTISGGLAMSCF